MNIFRFSAKSIGFDGSQFVHAHGAGIPIRHRIMATLVFAAIMVITFAALDRVPAKFRTTVNLIVLLSDDYASRPVVGLDVAPGSAMDRDAYMSAETNILMSRSVIDEAINHIGPDVLYPQIDKPPSALQSLLISINDRISGLQDSENDKATRSFFLARRKVESSLHVDTGHSGNVITVTYENTNANVAAKFLSELLNAYFARRSALFADEQAEILARRVETTGKELEAARSALAEFRRKYAISDFGLQRELLLRRRADLEKDLVSTKIASAEAQARRRTVQAQLASLPTDNVQSTGGRLLLVRHGVAAGELEMEADRLDQELNAAAVKQPVIEERLEATRRELSDLDAREGDLGSLNLDRDVLERQYSQSLQTLKERQSIEAVEQARRSNVKLVDGPEAADQPTSQRKLIAVTGLLLAMFGSGGILILGRFRRTGLIEVDGSARKQRLDVDGRVQSSRFSDLFKV